jgi:peptidyl-prolyl cis-trans isomerase A (cyclophilin A)
MRHMYVLAVLLCMSCSSAVFKSKWTNEKAPSSFVARFETTKGSFDVQVTRAWSPLAADRFYQLVRHNYFDSAIFYRVLANFVAQVGSSDTSKNSAWHKFKIADEEVVKGNAKGHVAFARAGKETRGIEIFINLKDNPRLDTITVEGVKGFPSLGEIIKGMEVVSALYAGYDKKSAEARELMFQNRSQFLTSFPNLDKVAKAFIVKE